MPLYLEHGQPVVTSVVHSFHVQECKLVALVDEGICNGICFGRELCPVVACKRRQAWDVIVSTTHWWQSGRCRVVKSSLKHWPLKHLHLSAARCVLPVAAQSV